MTTLGLFVQNRRFGDRQVFVVLSDPLCAALESPQDNKILTALAVFVLSHEIAHAQGEYNEGRANCKGVELFPAVTRELGLEDIVAGIDPLQLARNVGDDEYRSAGC